MSNKIYTATRRLKLRAGHLQFDARTWANQGTNKATTIYNSHLRDIYPNHFLMWIILFIILRSSFVSCQCDSFMRHSTLRSPFVFARIFRLYAISLCDFHLFPVFDLRSWVFLRCKLNFSLFMILVHVQYHSKQNIIVTTLLPIAILILS